MKILYLLPFFVIFLSGCGSKDELSQNIPLLDLEKVNTEKEIYLSELADLGELIELESIPASFVKSISDSYITDEFIIVCDNQIPKVSVYSRDGRFLRNIGSIGKGPGEFSGHIHFCFYEPENLIYIHSFSQSRICVYNIKGQWIKDFNTSRLCKYPLIDVMEFIGHNLVVILRRPVFEIDDFYQVWFFDKQLNVIDKKKHIPPSQKAGYDMQEPIDNARFNDGLLYFDFYGDTLFYIDKKLNIKPLLKLKYNRMPNDLAQKKGVFEKNRDYSKIRGFSSIPPYVTFALVQNTNDTKTIYYNLQTNESTLVTRDPCKTYLNSGGIINDITGISGFYGGEYYSSGFKARIVSRWIISGYVDEECIEEKSKKYPEIMNRYKQVFSDDKLEGNPVVELIYMKQ